MTTSERARVAARRRRVLVRLVGLDKRAATENEAAETHEHRFTRVGYSADYGVLYECIECGCEPVSGLDSARLPAPSSVSSSSLPCPEPSTQTSFDPISYADTISWAMDRILSAGQR